MAHLSIIEIVGQSNSCGSSSLIDPGGGGTKDLNDLGTQTTADLAGLYCHDHYSELASPYGWGDIRGHNGYYNGEYTNGSSQPFMVGGPEVGINRHLYELGYRNMAYMCFWGNFSSLEGGHSQWYKGNTLWNAWQAKRAARLAELTGLGHTYQIIGLVWHQGIDNARAGITQSQIAYEADQRQIFTDWRTDYASTNTPIVLAKSINSTAIGSGPMAPIRAGQVAMGPDYSGIVDTDDLTPYVDTHHMSYNNQLVIGDRFGSLLWSTLGYQITDEATHFYIEANRLTHEGQYATTYIDDIAYTAKVQDGVVVKIATPTKMVGYVSGS